MGTWIRTVRVLGLFSFLFLGLLAAPGHGWAHGDPHTQGGGKADFGKISLSSIPTSKPFVGDNLDFQAKITPPKDAEGNYTHSLNGVTIYFSPGGLDTTNSQGTATVTWEASHPGGDGWMWVHAQVEENYRGGYEHGGEPADAGKDSKRIQVVSGTIKLEANKERLPVDEQVQLTATLKNGNDTLRFYVEQASTPFATEQTTNSAVTVSYPVSSEAAVGPGKIRFRVEADDQNAYPTPGGGDGNPEGSATANEADVIWVGVEKIIVAGSIPKDEGPAYIRLGKEIKLEAIPEPEDAEFPSGYPTWSITDSPEGSDLDEWTDTGATVIFEPDVPGEYTVTAECGTSSDSFVIHTTPRLDDLTGTAKHDGNLIPINSITVHSVTDDKLYVCPSNGVELSIKTTPTTLPSGIGSTILFTVEGAGASPSAGNFGGGNPVINLGTGVGSALLYTVRVGFDDNGNGTLEEEEETHGFLIQKIDFMNAKIYANRTSTPVESAYPTKAGEHYEAGGTFKWELRHALTGDGPPIYYEYWDTDYFNELIQAGPGTQFSRTISSSATELGNVWVRFYCDADGDTAYDSGDQSIDITFWVQEKKVYDLEVEYSTAIGGLNTGAVQPVFTSSANRALRKDSEDDWRACIEMNVKSLVSFSPSSSRPDPANTPSKRQLHYAEPHDVTLLDDLGGGLRGEAYGTKIVIDWHDREDDTIVHELGHTQGISGNPHPSHGNDYIMTSGATRNVPADLVHESEVEKFDQ